MPDTAESSDKNIKNSEAENDASIPGEDFPIVLFDGVCHLCDRSVRFVLERDLNARFHFAPLQSVPGRKLLEKHGLPPDSIDGVVLIDRGTVHTKSSAALRIVGQLSFPWWTGILFLGIPKPLRDAVYGIVARHRYRWFGKSESCMVPDPRWEGRFHE